MRLAHNLSKLFCTVYRKLIPVQWRRGLWDLYWLWVSLRTDYRPQSLIFTLDYDQYWAGRTQRAAGTSISYRELITLCAAEIPEGSQVLDFGCGAGELLSELRCQRKVVGTGLDISERAVTIARQRGVDARTFNLTQSDDLIPLGNFDVAIATEVLEHIPQAELILVALSKVADRVLISIPNSGYLNYRLRLLAGRFPRQWHEHPAEHVRFWTMADFRYTAQLAGFEIVRISGVGGGRLGRLFPSLLAPDLFFVLSTSAASK